jgi:site-specific recombinase XerD
MSEVEVECLLKSPKSSVKIERRDKAMIEIPLCYWYENI